MAQTVTLPVALLERLVSAVEKMTAPPLETDFSTHLGYYWNEAHQKFETLDDIQAPDLDHLKGIDYVKELLYRNTESFAKGYPANNALLWGSRGMGKSSLVKSVFKDLSSLYPGRMAIIEINRNGILRIQDVLKKIRSIHKGFILFCDDLSFSERDESYNNFKTLLEGGIAGKPDNVLFYATSNYRHLNTRMTQADQAENKLLSHEMKDDSLSLADRFGLWLGFYDCSQEDYLLMIETYLTYFKAPFTVQDIYPQALEWTVTRGRRSGRVAWRFVRHILGTHEHLMRF